MQIKRIFLSGPMSNLPDSNYPAFNAAAAKLRAAGFHVESPAENPKCETWGAYMLLSVAQLLTCDTVVRLPGWENSRGACRENDLAIDFDMLILDFDEALENIKSIQAILDAPDTPENREDIQSSEEVQAILRARASEPFVFNQIRHVKDELARMSGADIDAVHAKAKETVSRADLEDALLGIGLDEQTAAEVAKAHDFSGGKEYGVISIFPASSFPVNPYPQGEGDET